MKSESEIRSKMTKIVEKLDDIEEIMINNLKDQDDPDIVPENREYEDIYLIMETLNWTIT
jgi:hypothetical protein